LVNIFLISRVFWLHCRALTFHSSLTIQLSRDDSFQLFSWFQLFFVDFSRYFFSILIYWSFKPRNWLGHKTFK
jgi:hypothetical protein